MPTGALRSRLMVPHRAGSGVSICKRIGLKIRSSLGDENDRMVDRYYAPDGLRYVLRRTFGGADNEEHNERHHRLACHVGVSRARHQVDAKLFQKEVGGKTEDRTAGDVQSSPR